MTARMFLAATAGVVTVCLITVSGGSLFVTEVAARGGGATGFVAPVPDAVITQPYGCSPYAMEPIDTHCPSGHFHSGVDLAAAQGVPVHATLPGTCHVVLSQGGYGTHVVVDHGNGLTSLYGHLSRASVTDGAPVSSGAIIGAVGSTGNSTGPHLHFEIRRDGATEDPARDVALP